MTAVVVALISATAVLVSRTSLRPAPVHEVTVYGLASEAPARPVASRSCAGTPASWLEGGIAEAARALAARSRQKGIPQAQREKHAEFVVDNLLFVLGHEAGHAVIREMGVPVVGREEDAADSFSTLMALTCQQGFGERMLGNAALGWFLSDRRDRRDQQRRGENAQANYYGAHGMDLQRAYNIVCLMVGSNPGKFASVADAAGLPQERQATCQDDWLNAKWSWDQVLQSHLRKPGQAKTSINVFYGAGNGKYDAHAAVFGQMKLLETVAESLSERFAWRVPIALEMQSCGESNARFEFRTRKVIVCYELADEFSELYRRYAGSMPFSPDAKVSATPARAGMTQLASGAAAGAKAHSRTAFGTGRVSQARDQAARATPRQRVGAE